MDARYQLIHQDNYLQVFGNKDFLVEAYPVKRKNDSYEGLDKFVKKCSAPDKMIYDGTGEQVGKKN